jgi:hypothetical protein
MRTCTKRLSVTVGTVSWPSTVPLVRLVGPILAYASKLTYSVKRHQTPPQDSIDAILKPLRFKSYPNRLVTNNQVRRQRDRICTCGEDIKKGSVWSECKGLHCFPKK